MLAWLSGAPREQQAQLSALNAQMLASAIAQPRPERRGQSRTGRPEEALGRASGAPCPDGKPAGASAPDVGFAGGYDWAAYRAAPDQPENPPAAAALEKKARLWASSPGVRRTLRPPTPAAVPASVASSVKASDGLYKHGVEITLEGSYQELSVYLERLEQAKSKLLWSSVSLSAEKHPRLVLTLTVQYSLSLERAWLIVRQRRLRVSAACRASNGDCAG